MNFWNRIKIASQVITKKNPQNILLPLLPQEYDTILGHWPSKGFEKFVNANLSYVYTCNTLIADRTASIKMRLFYFDSQGNKVAVTDHIFLDTMKNVNPFMNEYELKNFTAQSLNLTGNAYWYLPRNAFNVPVEIWPILPQNIRVVPSKDKFILGYLYRDHNGRDVSFTPDEIVQFRTTSLKDIYYGMSPIEAGAFAIDLNENMKMHSINVFKNQALPSGMLQVNGIYDADAEKRIRENWKKSYQGVDKAGKTMIVWGDTKYQQLSISPRDLDFVNGQKLSREEICGVFKVPMALIITENVNRSNMETAEYTLAKNVIVPMTTLIQEKINEKIMPMYDKKLFVEYDNPVPKWFEDIIAERKVNLDSGFSSINEERVLAGRGEVAWGNRPFIPFNLYPYGTTPESPPSETPGEGKAHKCNHQSKEGQETKAEIFWKAGIKRTEPITKQLHQAMIKFFRKQMERVLAELNTQKSVVNKLTAKEIFSLAKENGLLKQIVKPFISDALDEGAKNSNQMFGLGVDWQLGIPRVQEWIGSRAEKFSKWANETTLSDLQAVVGKGVDLGESIPKLADRIESYFDGVIAFRSEMIARTEVITASNEGNLEIYREAGIEQKQWYVALDERTCPYCMELDQAIVGINENFKSDEFGDVEGPTLHPNCRCTIIPLI